jgi:hypothetical protein
MDLTTEMVVEIFQQQTVPMVIPIFILQHLAVKLLHYRQLLIIYKVFLDLSMNRQQLPIMWTVLIPIIKSNNTKIWFTGRWKDREKNARTKIFFFIHLLSSRKRRARESKTNLFDFFLVSWRLILFHTYACPNIISLCLKKWFLDRLVLST